MGPGASGAAAMAANGGTQTPLDVDRLEEVRSTRGREPISIEIVRRASRIRDLETIRDAMVVYCDLATAPLVIAGLAHGANQARLFPDVQTTSDYAEEHFRFPTQRIVGGAIPAVDPDTTDRVPLTPEELSATTAAFNQAQTELQTADKEVGRLSRMEASLQKSFASPSQSLGRLVNPARSTAALKKRQANAALAAATAGAAHARLGKLVETSSKPREPLSAEVAKGWRQPIATEFHELMTNRALLLSAPTALDALEPVFGAKRLVLCGFGNLDSVRERVLAWWSSVSTIDAEQHPDINTRVVLVCGPESAERPVSTSAVDADGRPLFLTVNVAVPQGAEAGNIIEIAANGGVKMSVTIPDGLGVGDSFPVDVPIPKEEEPTANPNGFTNNKQHLFEEAEPELPAAELLAGLLLFQLMQCADVEIEDLSPDGATRHCLRAIINASRVRQAHPFRSILSPRFALLYSIHASARALPTTPCLTRDTFSEGECDTIPGGGGVRGRGLESARRNPRAAAAARGVSRHHRRCRGAVRHGAVHGGAVVCPEGRSIHGGPAGGDEPGSTLR